MAVQVAPGNWRKEIAKLSSVINSTAYFVLLKACYFSVFGTALLLLFFI